MLCEEARELRQVALDLIEVRLFLDGDVEQGARVAARGGLVGHRVSGEFTVNSSESTVTVDRTMSPQPMDDVSARSISITCQLSTVDSLPA